ncbi:hypothetical protein IV203_012926 [Nitzschia inconspicua]|uniref:Uncharacterized protein n=1 Tax=Nitzschia inconspicua TaxID=303405 RepID=A0A9K3M7W4_9STRA|nr:hypothetical protein IV203_012926 [Nitzschia inconspicua]
MIEETPNDEETHSVNVSVNSCSKETVSSNDLSDLLKYQGIPSLSIRSPTAHNVALHTRMTCSPSSLQIPTTKNQEEDLLDEFFNTVQEFVCQQHEQHAEAGGRQVEATQNNPTSPHSMLSAGSGKYEKDIIDFVFENVENVTCNKPYDETRVGGSDNAPTLHDTLEKLQTLGKSVHLKLYRKDPETVQKRVNEWFANKFQTDLPTSESSEDEIEVEREMSSDFMDVFFQRMENVLCLSLPLDKVMKMDGPQNEKDVLDKVFDSVESVVCEPKEVSTILAFQRSERSERSIVTPTNHSSTRTPSVLLLSPASAASNSFGETPRSLGDESYTNHSWATESECSPSSHTAASSVGIFSYSERSSRMAYSALSPRSGRSERTDGSESCLSPRTEASCTDHSRRSTSHSGRTEERDNRTLLSDSSSQEEGDGGDESTTFNAVSRPLFVIKEEVSATESMMSERRQKESLLHAQQASSIGCGLHALPLYSNYRTKPRSNCSFRYSSAHYKFQKSDCTPDTAARTAQDWIERFKYVIEVSVSRLTTAVSGLDSDKLCSHFGKEVAENREGAALPKNTVDDETDEPSHFEKWSSALDKYHERVAAKNVSGMCSRGNEVDDRNDIDVRESDLASKTIKSSLLGLIGRSRFASASLVPSLEEDENNGADDDSFRSYSTNDQESTEKPRRQQEPPEHKQSPINTPYVSINSLRGRDPEPSFQLKLEGDTIVGNLRNYATCSPRKFLDDFEKPKSHEGIRSPRSSETERTADLTATTSGAMPYDDDNISTAAQISVDNMVVCLPAQRRGDQQLQEPKTKSGSSSMGYFDLKQDTPHTVSRESSSDSSRTKEMSFHTAKVFSIFDEEDGTIFTQDNDGTCYSYPSDMDIQRTCTDIVVYEKKPDFIRLWLGKDAKFGVSPWQLVVYVAWLSVSFLVRVNGEVNSQLAERKRVLQAILEDDEQSEALSRGFSRDSFDAIPSIDCQLSLE